MATKFNYSISDKGSVTAAAGAATLNKSLCVVTSEALTTAAAGTYTLTLTNSRVAADSFVNGSIKPGTATTGEPIIGLITPAAGSVVVTVKNVAASAALNGTIVVSLEIVNAKN